MNCFGEFASSTLRLLRQRTRAVRIGRQSRDAFAEIDAEAFDKALRDPRHILLADAAAKHIAQLRREGRID